MVNLRHRISVSKFNPELKIFSVYIYKFKNQQRLSRGGIAPSLLN